ncbi:carboxypeptidase regulatory-like domain-containing protein [candidate division KSB1 bacterium]|nr:carboxypeptidase regulatory-like domain-containing protein [candidate division KSB1 bacterium]
MKKSIPLIFPLLLCLSCFQKQDHDIIAPQIPVYTLSGRVISSLDKNPVDNALVTLYGGAGDIFINMEYVTDSSGIFTFSQVPGGYGYQLAIEKQGYRVSSNTWNVDYSDKSTGDIVLGKWLIEESTFYYNGYNFTGIVRVTPDLWLLTSDFTVIQINAGMTVQKSGSIKNITPSGLAWDGNHFWTSDTVNHKLVKFNIQNDGAPAIVEKLPLPDNPYQPSQYLNLRDLCWYGDVLLACESQIGKKFCRFDPFDSGSLSLIDSPESTHRPVAITGADSTLYMQCRYYQDIILYLLDQNYNNKGFLVVPEMNGRITTEGNILWFARENYVKKFRLSD